MGGGICHNYNNGLKYAKGEWVKFIAGDDILKPNCIEEFVNYTTSSNDKFLICREHHFSKENPDVEIKPIDSDIYSFLAEGTNKVRVKRQILHLLRQGTIICGPTLFLEVKTLRQLGCFEEKYPFIEDFPLAMKYLMNGYPIGAVDRVLIEYRVSSTSVSHSDNRFSYSIFNAIDDYCIPASKKYHKYALWYHHKLNSLIRQHKLPKFGGYFLRMFDLINWKNKVFKNKVSK